MTMAGAMPAGALALPLALVAGSDTTTCSSGPDGETNCETPEPPEGTPELAIPAIAGTLSMTEAGGLDVDGLSVGVTVRATLDGRPLMALDVSAAFNLGLDLSLAPGGDDTRDALVLTVRPALQLDLDLANLPASRDVLAWARDEGLSARVDGAAWPSPRIFAGSSTREVPDPDGGGSGDRPLPTPPADSLVEVLAERMTLAARSLPQPAVVESGMCLLPVEADDEAAHALSIVAAGACQ